MEPVLPGPGREGSELGPGDKGKEDVDGKQGQAARMGNSMVMVATLEVSSVRNVTLRQMISRRSGMGMSPSERPD